ncbi:choice-of-anchor I family protein [Macrococcus brunensis]|uniref:choice-of-anchor I family protein n=1 Tax=Macrococcus brunensis TaxID=198483 RepID=UPI001EF0F58C|nr:choice-of-anchor I family protein [Macrococcus brunensis]ULG73292.1 choice-of-anchor I family protein [Macrococcus brunensis]
MNKLVKVLSTGTLAALMLTPYADAASVSSYSEKSSLKVSQLARYDSKTSFGESGTEIVAYDKKYKRAYSINGALNSLDILDASKLTKGKMPLLKRVALKDFNAQGSDITSVAIHPQHKYIAVSVPAANKTDNGHVVFLSMNGKFKGQVEVGALPDMLTFTPNGNNLVVANEGEPNDEYTVNPEGSVSVIRTKPNGHIKQSDVTTTYFDRSMIGSDVRELGRNAEESFRNLEPEYITVDNNNKLAYITIQERNAVATYDIKKKKFVSVKGLGYKDYHKTTIDVSDKDDKINMKNYPLFGMYQPDGISHLNYKGHVYLLTANEGDTQDYKGFSEETRVADIADQYNTASDYFKGFDSSILKDKKSLGRLKTSTSNPFTNADGTYDAVVTFGGRSFSVVEADSMKQVYDSGDDFEKIIAKAFPDAFNSQQEEPGKIEFDNRSDDKGPEAESVTVGKVGKHQYAFIGLERTGGIMVYNMDNPTKPVFETYFKSKDNKDISPEGLTFIPKEESPTKKPLLMASHEMSGTIAVYEFTGK